MQSKQSWLGDQAFGDDAHALVTISYQSHQDAQKFMQSVLRDHRGVGLVQGPVSSGKTTIVQRLVGDLPSETAVAFVDGTRIKPRELLSRILAQFGYHTGLESIDELLKMVEVFAVQQTRSCEPPVLIVDNVDRMYPSALSTLNTLAAIEVQQRFAIRVVLTGREGLSSIIASDGMANIAERSIGTFIIDPLSLREALMYLHARLAACGVNNADTVFPVDVCDRLFAQSDGWPGLMNQFAIEAMRRATNFPLRLADTSAQEYAEDEAAPAIPDPGAGEAVEPELPRLIITKDGKTVSEYTFNEKKVLIGRSDFADIVLDDEYASKQHVLMLLYSDAVILLDLNSANGTTVNSRRVRTTILKSNDIVAIGDYRLKVENAPALSEEMAKLLKAPDTIKMKNIVDMRRLRESQHKLVAIAGKQQH